MTTVLEILARASRQCSVNAPPSWLAASDQTSQEVLDFLEMTVTDIQDRLELVGPLSGQQVITGTGAENYALPADFHRLQRGEYSVYERLNTRRACLPVSDDGQWEYLQEYGAAGANRYYRLTGYPGSWQIGFERVLETDLTAVVSYVSTNWLINGVTYKPMFTAEEDICLLPRELVESGIVWRFRQRKALDYADVQMRYETLMARYGNDSRTLRKVHFGSVPMRSPWDIPVPDFIPSA